MVTFMENTISVLKFGGTSVGSGERIRQVATIIANTLKESDEVFPVVIVSAMSGVTNQLLEIARSTCSGEYEACEYALKALQQKHFEAVEKAVQNRAGQSRLYGDLEIALKGLDKDIEALRLAAEQDQNVLLCTAAVAAWGERLSVLLTAAAACDIGLQAEPVCQEVIITSHPKEDSSLSHWCRDWR